jgi:UDP-3-O-[3-hydroxymyristoyl] glucosamine N-acyltransferase
MEDLRRFWGKNLTIDETAVIHPSALLRDDVTINAGAQIGPRTIIGSGAFIDNFPKINATAVSGIP